MPTPRTLRQLGGLAENGGYFYALLYSTGVVQVGRAQDARAGIAERRATARQLGVAVADWWVSEPVEEWTGAERQLAAACRDLGGKEVGAGSFRGVDFGALCATAQEIKAEPAVARRVPAWTQDERMAVAARLRAEGRTLRESAGLMLVSHGTVRRDLIRWDKVRDQLPEDIVSLSVPVTPQPCYIAPSITPATEPDVTAACNESAIIIPLRRPA